MLCFVCASWCSTIYLSIDYSFIWLCILYVWLNLLRWVERLKWLQILMLPLLSTISQPLSTRFRSNCFEFEFPCNWFCFPDRALPFPFPNKNIKPKMIEVFSNLFIRNCNVSISSRILCWYAYAVWLFFFFIRKI